MSDQPRTAEQARSDAQKILERAKGDSAFLDQLKNQPVETLQAAGFPLDEAQELSQEFGTGEVSGYMRCTYTCDRWTCIVSFCGNIPLTD